MILTEKTRTQILELQKRYPEKRSALIPALHLAQKEKGYLPAEIQQEVAELFNITLNEVNSIVTFYDMFYDHPVQKRSIHLCKGISCMLNGCDPLAKALKEKAPADVAVHLSECLGACDLAPMAIVDEEVRGPIQNVDQLLKRTS